MNMPSKDATDRSEPHTARERASGRVALWGFVIITALVVGAAVGYSARGDRTERVFVYCTDDVKANAVPCPPPEGVVVLASWAGGLTTRASWDGGQWRFAERVVGQLGTREFPEHWTTTP